MATYTIIDYAALELVNFDELLTTSIETCRKSVDKTKVVIHWEGDLPPSLETLNHNGPYYTVNEIGDALNNPEWIHPDPFHMEQ